MRTRYLVKDEPDGRQFVEIQWMDTEYYVRRGHAGDTGTIEVGQLRSQEKVEAVIEARVRALLAEGWVETQVPP